MKPRGYILHFSFLTGLLFLGACDPKSDLGNESAFSGNRSETSNNLAITASDPPAHDSSSAGSSGAGPADNSSGGGGSPYVPPAADTTIDTSAFKIDEKGFLQGPGVSQQVSDALTSQRGFGEEGPKGIILHKTAGLICNPNNTVPAGYEKPHVYVCQDGRVIVTGSFDYPRTSAEKGHNSWSLNVEFESPYQDKSKCRERGELTQGGWGHCYEPLTPKQLTVGKQVVALLSQRYKIPQQLALPIENQAQYAAEQTLVLPSGSQTLSGPRNVTIDEMPKGVLPSYWTAIGQDDNTNHDDGPSWYDLQGLGLVNNPALTDTTGQEAPPTS